MAISSVSDTGPPVSQPASQPAVQARSTGGSSAVRTPSQATSAPSIEQVQQAIKTVQEMVQSQASNLHFSLDKETGKAVVTVVDSNTNEVIRQIPSKEMIAIAHAIDQMQSKGQGLMLNQQA